MLSQKGETVQQFCHFILIRKVLYNTTNCRQDKVLPVSVKWSTYQSPYLCMYRSHILFHSFLSKIWIWPTYTSVWSGLIYRTLICPFSLNLYNSMEQSPLEANSHSAGWESSCLLWNLKIHYCVHQSLVVVPILSQINIVYILPTYSFKIHLILSFHLYLGLPSGILPSGFPTKILYVFLISPLCANAPPILSSLIWSPE